MRETQASRGLGRALLPTEVPPEPQDHLAACFLPTPGALAARVAGRGGNAMFQYVETRLAEKWGLGQLSLGLGLQKPVRGRGRQVSHGEGRRRGFLRE